MTRNEHQEEEALPDGLRADKRSFRRCDIYDAADWYDVDYAAYRAELPFYRSVLAKFGRGRTVVELGAGTGRLTIPLLQDGFVLHAVEPSAPMRGRLTQKAQQAGVSVVVEDARADDFRGPGAFGNIGVVMFPFNGLLHIKTKQELRATFTHVHDKLARHGSFCFDLTPPYWETLLRGRVPWGRVDERVHPTSGRTFLTCDRSQYDEATRSTRIDIRYAYAGSDEEGVEIALFQRMWTAAEVVEAVLDCGFSVDNVYGDVDFSSSLESSPRLLVSAIKNA